MRGGRFVWRGRRLAAIPVPLDDDPVLLDHGCAQALPPDVELAADGFAVALDM